LRQPLPIDGALEDVRAAIHRSRAVVIVADPGAGKTTRVPPALIDKGAAILLQPRRAAARAIAQRIAWEQRWTVGREVGWHIRFERNFTDSTRLLVATEGILTARLQDDPLLSQFATVILDEFHERSVHADLAIALSRQAMHARDDLRLVVMSATIDAERVAAYLGDCPIVQVPGRLHPVKVAYCPGAPMVEVVSRALADSPGNLLVFQPGAAEIRRAVEHLRAALPRHIDVLPLHGTLPADEQQLALSDPGRARRVTVSTNVAETSVTVPGVTAVVDSGLEKVARYDADRGIDSLTTERISQAAAEQRAGRAGRVAPGNVYRLWEPADRLKAYREPEVQRVDLTAIALDVIAWGGDPRAFDWFDEPPAAALDAALRLLERLGATRGGRLSDIGRQMLHLPIPPRLARIVIAGEGSRDVIRACAALSEPHVVPPGTATASSDLLAVVDRWAEVPERVARVAADIERLSRTSLTTRPPSNPTEEGFRRAILAGYPDRIARRRDAVSGRVLMSTGTGAVLADESVVRNAEYLVALETRSSPRPGDPESRIRLASAIEREWLEPTASEVVHRLDEHGAVRAFDVVRYDALVLMERPVRADPECAAALVAAAYIARGPSESDLRLLHRAAFAGRPLDFESLVRLAAYGAPSVDAVDIACVLPLESSEAIERGAPVSLIVPSGRRVTLEYAADGSVSAAVKLQELFGLGETPRIGARREPVLFSLLAPNGRPVQRTKDLRSFWERTYPKVRRELRGRYPRHPWPEDPWTARPTARVKPRTTP
jgi:ATP-dependent helicase HrpB